MVKWRRMLFNSDLRFWRIMRLDRKSSGPEPIRVKYYHRKRKS